MTRLRADLLLLLTALIWGSAFIAQKNAFAHVGPLTFVAARFFVSAVLLAPFVLREQRLQGPLKDDQCPLLWLFGLVGLAFAAANILQQWGIMHTSVTNAGFLTGLYVVIVPFLLFLFWRMKQSRCVLLAAGLSIIGVKLLTGGDDDFSFGIGDLLVLLGAVGFAIHVIFVSIIVQKCRSVFLLSFIQYMIVAVVALVGALLFEDITGCGLLCVWPEIFYAGAVSGAFAYTLQIIAQRHTPAADAAIIMSGEALFAAIAGWWILGEEMTLSGKFGCALILSAILLVELGPRLHRIIKQRMAN